MAVTKTTKAEQAWVQVNPCAVIDRVVDEINDTVGEGFTQMPLQADSVATDAAGIVSDFNDLLAALQAAGLMASS